MTIATPLGKKFIVYDIPLANGTVTGKRLTWTQHVTKPTRLILRFEVRADDDSMTVKAGILPSSQVSGICYREPGLVGADSATSSA